MFPDKYKYPWFLNYDITERLCSSHGFGCTQDLDFKSGEMKNVWV